MPSTRDFWKIRKMMVAGTMDRVDMASVEPMSEPEDGSLNNYYTSFSFDCQEERHKNTEKFIPSVICPGRAK